MRTGIFAARVAMHVIGLLISIVNSIRTLLFNQPAGKPAGCFLFWIFIMTSPVSKRAAGKPLALALAVGAAFSSSVQAQDKSLAPVVVTATRTPQIATEVLSDNIVITSEEIAKSAHTSLVDLLQSRRGVEITRNGGPGANASLFIRGAENKQNVVLVDGMRVGSATTGGATWSNIPLSQIDRIEIVYGPMSTLYGADAVGGVVQIFTKKGDGPPQPTASVGVGSDGKRAWEAGVSGANAGVNYAIGVSREWADGFSSTKPGAWGFNPDRDGYDRKGASGSFGIELAKGHEIGANFLFSRLDAEYDNGSSRNDDRNIHYLNNYGVYSRNKLSSVWTSQLQLGLSSDKTSNISSFPSRFHTEQRRLSWQNDVTVAGSDVLQIVLERLEEEVDTTTAALNRERTTNAVAAAYQLKRGAHLANVAVRNDDSSQYGSRTTGSLAYGYRLTNALRVNASAGTSFRAPTFNELYFPNYGFAGNVPEKGRNVETGLYYDNGKSQFSAVYYRNRVTDLIVTARPCPGNPLATAGCAYNVNKALLTGISLGAGTKLGDFSFRGSIDFQDPEDETTGRRLARRAKRHGTLAAEYGAGALNAGAELVFSSDRYDEAANVNKLGGYGLLNLFASYALAPNWSLFGRWDNVLDKEYELARNYNTSGSAVFVGLRYGMR